MNKINILLVFPPVWSTDYPYLSIPSLKSYLEMHGIKAHQIDLNIEFWENLQRRDSIKEVYDNIRKYGSMKRKKDSIIENIEYYLIAREFSKITFEEFLSRIISGKIDRTTFRFLLRVFGKNEEKENTTKESTLYYHDMLYRRLSYSSYALSCDSLIKKATENNRFYDFYDEYFSDILSKKHPDILGISVISVNQAVPAFTLAHFAKKKFRDIHIVIGGPWCTQLYDVLPHKKELFDLTDSIIFFDGEKPFLELAKSLSAGRHPEGIKNLCFKKKNRIICNGFSKSNGDINMLPTPDFDGLSLEKYDIQGILPLQTSKGCYWGRCVYCSYPVTEPIYRRKSNEKIIKEITYLNKKYNIKKIFFMDSCMHPSVLKALAEDIIRKNMNIQFGCFARLDSRLIDILPLIHKAGFRILEFGLETASKRMLKIIDKGITPENAKRVLKKSMENGIYNRIFVMYNLPDETEKEASMTKKFLENNLKYIDSFIATRFTPERHTKIDNMKKELNLNFLKNPEHDLAIGYIYRSGRMTETQITKVKNDFDIISNKLKFIKRN